MFLSLLLVQMPLLSHGALSEMIPSLPDRGVQASVLGRTPSEEDYRAGEEIRTILAQLKGPVLAEAPTFAIQAGKPVVANATHLRNLYQVGLWDPSPLVAEVSARQYDAVLLNAELYPEPVLAAIGRHYYQARTISMSGATYQIFLPGAN